jgi:hypothetical protein
MPLDNNLNKDLHDDVDRQVAATKKLDEDDENKFCMSTPNRATSAYLRVQIVQDIHKVVTSWINIRDNRGGYVDKLVGIRHGKRYDRNHHRRRKMGGKHTAKRGRGRSCWMNTVMRGCTPMLSQLLI